MIRRPFLVIALLSLGSLGAAGFPTAAAAQIEAAGSTKLSLSGSGFLGSASTDLTNIFGLSRFGSSGWEIGGDIMLSVRRDEAQPTYEYDEWTGEVYEVEGEGSSVTTSGFMFGRIAYNFIGESTMVPFLYCAVFLNASSAITRPPRSAMFSPSAALPLMRNPGSGS